MYTLPHGYDNIVNKIPWCDNLVSLGNVNRVNIIQCMIIVQVHCTYYNRFDHMYLKQQKMNEQANMVKKTNWPIAMVLHVTHTRV